MQRSSQIAEWPKMFVQAVQAYISTTRRGERLATLAIPIRLVLLYGVVIRFGINRADLGDYSLLNAVRFSVSLLFIYVLALGYLRVNHPEIFVSNRCKLFQILLDTLVFSLLFFLTQNAKSDFFLLYLIPLVIAADYLDLTPNVLVFILVSIAFTSTAYAITMVFAPYPEQLFLRVLAPRLLLFGGFALGYWVLRRLSPALSLDQDRSRLSQAFSALSTEPYLVGSDYRLLWVSPKLQARHGEYFSEKTCFTYFTGHSGPCPDCPLGSILGTNFPYKDRVTITARDISGAEYEAEITFSPVLNGGEVQAAAVLRDVTAWKQCDHELEAYAARVDELADAQVGHLAEQMQRIGSQLAGFFEATMLSTVVDQLEEEALQAILAQFAQRMNSSVAILRTSDQNEAGQCGLVLRAAYGLSEERRSKVVFLPIDAKSPVMKAFELGESQACLDVQDRSQPVIYFVDLAQQDGLHSMASFPLLMHSESIGTCTFYRDKILPFTPDEKALGQAMANLLAIALDNLQLYRGQEQRTRERQSWLNILHELSTSLAGYEPLESTMRKAVELANERLQAETAAIFLWEDGKLRRKAIAGVLDNWFLEESYGFGEGLTGAVVVPALGQRYGQPILRNNVDEDPDVLQPNVEKYREALLSHEVKHLIAVPLNDREHSFGVLRVVNRLEGGKLSTNGFTERDMDLLGIVATQVAMAIENHRLFEAEKERRELAERLATASIAVTSSLELSHILEQILDQLRMVVPYDSVSVQILRPDGFHIVACRGFDDPEEVKSLTFPLQPDFPNTRVFQRQEAQIIDDVQSEYRHFADPRWQGTHIRSWLGVPMSYRGRIIGMIALDSRIPGFYQIDHADIASSFATQAAIALANAELFEGTSRQARRSRQMVEVGRRLNSLNDIRSLSNTVAESAIFAVENADGAVLHQLDLSSGKLQPVASWPVGRIIAMEPLTTLGRIAGVALQTRKTITIPDATLGVRFEGALDKDQLRSLLVAPLYAGEKKLIGTLSVYNSRARAFDETDVDLLTMLASLAGVAWANIEMWQAREERRQQVERLLEAVRKFDMDIGPRELCRRITQVVCEVLGWKAAAIKVLDTRKENFMVYAAFPDTGPEAFVVQGTSYPAAQMQAMIEKAIHLNHCLLVRGAYDRMRGQVTEKRTPFLDESGQPMDWWPGDALLIPLATPELDIIGYLALANPGRQSRPSMDDIQLIEVLSSQAVVAIARAFLYEQTTAQRDWLQGERAQLEDELHEAMNVLATGVRWEIDTTRQAFLEGRTDDAKSGLDRMQVSAKRTYEDLRYILGDLGNPILRQKGLIPALLDYVSVVGQGKVTGAYDEIGRLHFGMEHTLYRIAQEAISNALKHAGIRERPDGQVQVQVSRSEGVVSITIVDNGYGFDVKMAGERKGPSGLKRMYEWANAAGVELHIDSVLGKGTKVFAQACIEGSEKA